MDKSENPRMENRNIPIKSCGNTNGSAPQAQGELYRSGGDFVPTYGEPEPPPTMKNESATNLVAVIDLAIVNSSQFPNELLRVDVMRFRQVGGLYDPYTHLSFDQQLYHRQEFENQAHHFHAQLLMVSLSFENRSNR